MKQKKSENFFNEKNVKLNKRSHAYRGYASTYNVEIVSSLNSELQLQDNEVAVENKLINVLSKLRGF